ncbi:hypothetical protein CLAFUW4_02451 [Fulvia fulva]|uniref:Uncharacterized protein n=1 Tax=Passalora fulva TaxID=5499 RepID=A0A9Q8P5V9_PASFU|nr:uncharacterized protein CLAFUR5_02441 [Fulvia fulva]KAK4631206.1 hypothetical protein CLAFUR4_02446 [Fulvia fulva]KAK4632885.1 hypothetical protein CLAFUR0_02450 [Fulvia fulva]UJO14520.1 hypothetical protein CLAFUR5_02441 [Fulvia fulva]WPV10823.1 hypothetical protein CLAFUW4_02451 [Fulvia fulva]WPV25718.1 hypothetical protein CLAFUW7_02451 [Fulvia fulva]
MWSYKGKERRQNLRNSCGLYDKPGVAVNQMGIKNNLNMFLESRFWRCITAYMHLSMIFTQNATALPLRIEAKNPSTDS